MKVKVGYYGQVAEILAMQSEEIELAEGMTTSGFLEFMKEKYPELSKCVFKIAVNQSLVEKELPLNQNDDVVLLPPFAGG